MSTRLRDVFFPESGKIRPILRRINEIIHKLNPSNIKKIIRYF